MTNPNTPEDELNSFDLAMWLINFEFQDPRNRHMTYRELARIYATKIEAFAKQDRTNLITQVRKERVVDADAEYDCGFNAGIDTAIEVLRSGL